MLLSIGATATATPQLSGYWESEITFGTPINPRLEWIDDEWVMIIPHPLPAIDPHMTLLGVESTLRIEYTISGWQFVSESLFTFARDQEWAVGRWWIRPDGWMEQDFFAEGKIGAFGVASHLQFVPKTPAFDFLRTTIDTAIAGLDLRGKSLLTGQGSGFRLRTGGTVDGITMTAELFSNMVMDPPDGLAYILEGIEEDWYWELVESVHDLRFTGLRASALFLITTIAELEMVLDFTTEEGFDDLTLTVPDIPLGIPQLSFDFQVKYTLAEKVVTITPAITLVDWIHIEPLVSLQWVDGQITGLSLDGLRMEYTRDIVTFTAFSRFDYVPVLEGTYYWQVYRLDIALPDIDLSAAIYFEKGAIWLFEAGKFAVDTAVEVVPGVRASFGLAFTDYGRRTLTAGVRVDW